MLPRAYRLTMKRDVERASRQGRPVHSPHLTIRAVWSGKETPRFAVVAGLKVSKRSVVRNRVKRIIREVIHRHLTAIRPGVDVVIHAKPTAPGVEYKIIAEEIGMSLNRAKLLQCPWVDTLWKSGDSHGE